MATFRDLPIGATFEFDPRAASFCSSMVHGPWRKRTARTYVYADNRSVQHFRVGTTRVEVRQDAKGCGR